MKITVNAAMQARNKIGLQRDQALQVMNRASVCFTFKDGVNITDLTKPMFVEARENYTRLAWVWWKLNQAILQFNAANNVPELVARLKINADTVAAIQRILPQAVAHDVTTPGGYQEPAVTLKLVPEVTKTELKEWVKALNANTRTLQDQLFKLNAMEIIIDGLIEGELDYV